MSTADLKLSYKLNRDDYWAAQARIQRQGPWRIVTIALGLWMVSVLAGSFHVMQIGPKWTVVELTFVALYGISGLALFIAVATRIIGRFILNRAMAQSGGGPLAPTTLDVGADGVSCTDETSQTWYTWDALERVEVTERLVLLYSSPVQAIMIPRRVFGDEDAMLRFVASMREKIMATQRHY